MVQKFMLALVVAAAAATGFVLARLGEYKSGVEWPEPPVVTAGANPGDAPSDATVLLGKDLGAWHDGEQWSVADGVATARKTGIRTKDAFGSCQLHLEFATPEKVVGDGQGRGNSGLFFGGVYEVQILDSFENKTYFDGQCASLYKQSPPMVNVCRKPGEWQTYDVVYDAPLFSEDNKVTRPAYITVIHNGVLVQNHTELKGGTFYDKPPSYSPHPEKTQISLQWHGNPVKFKNIWVRELHPLVGVKREGKAG